MYFAALLEGNASACRALQDINIPDGNFINLRQADTGLCLTMYESIKKTTPG